MEVTLIKVKSKNVIMFFAEVEEIVFCGGNMFEVNVGEWGKYMRHANSNIERRN
jgi:hypothetical protein